MCAVWRRVRARADRRFFAGFYPVTRGVVGDGRAGLNQRRTSQLSVANRRRIFFRASLRSRTTSPARGRGARARNPHTARAPRRVEPAPRRVLLRGLRLRTPPRSIRMFALAASAAQRVAAPAPETARVGARGRNARVAPAAAYARANGGARGETRVASAARIAAGVSTTLASALVALPPALADEAVAQASTEISPFAGVVDITVLGVVALLAVQGNKKAEAAKAAGKGTKKR